MRLADATVEAAPEVKANVYELLSAVKHLSAGFPWSIRECSLRFHMLPAASLQLVRARRLSLACHARGVELYRNSGLYHTHRLLVSELRLLRWCQPSLRTHLR